MEPSQSSAAFLGFRQPNLSGSFRIADRGNVMDFDFSYFFTRSV